MGRLITYDNVVQENLNSLIKNKVIQTGLIIGQYTAQKDIVLRLCVTPTNDEEANEEEVDADLIPHNKAPSFLPDIDEPWICQHSKQLVRALPGGLDVLGFFTVAPTDYTTKNQVHLRQVLFSIFKVKNVKLKMSLKERILLTVCPITSKIVCRTYDVSDYKSSATPAEWKMQMGAHKWHRLRTRLSIDIKFPFKRVELGSLSLQTQIELSLHTYFENIQNAVVLFDGIQREMDESFDTSVESKRSKKKPTNEKNENSLSKWHDVELYIPLKSDNISSPEIFPAASMMTFKGIVQCLGYVHGKATVQEAINALKQDIIRSINSRCEIHCEDLLLIEEEQSDPSVVHELPRRVFAPLPQGDICVCDYQFHSDTACDSLEAFKELLNLELSEEDIDCSYEVSPTTSTLILPEAIEDKLSEFGDGPARGSSMMLDKSQKKSIYKEMLHWNIFAPVIGVVTTIAVGVLAFVIKSQWS